MIEITKNGIHKYYQGNTCCDLASIYTEYE